MIKTIVNDLKLCEKIRKAHSSGRKSILIDGSRFIIRRIKRKVTFTVTNRLGEKQEIKRNEAWLVVTLAEGEKPVGVEVAQISYPKNDSNVRSKW